MLRAQCPTMTILALLLGNASLAHPSDPGANAALQYWQAFATLPPFTVAEAKKLREECLTMPLDSHARAIVARAAYALRMMHRGAAQSRCDWAVRWEEEGIDALLPYLDGVRTLSSLVCLRARLRFEEGESAEAINDIVVALTLSRHASMDGSFIAILIGYQIEGRLSETLALYLPKLNDTTIKDLRKRLDALPAGGRPATALRECEEKTLDWLIRKVKEAKDKESLLAFASGIAGSPEKGRAFLEECGGAASDVVTFTEGMRPSYARMAKIWDLPLSQFEKEWDREKLRQAGNPVFKMLFSAFYKVRVAQMRADIRRALLSAALAVRLDGPGALKNHPDPVVGGPFEHNAFEDGFELRSKWKLEDQLRSKWKLDESFDKPLVLTVGRRGK